MCSERYAKLDKILLLVERGCVATHKNPIGLSYYSVRFGSIHGCELF